MAEPLVSGWSVVVATLNLIPIIGVHYTRDALGWSKGRRGYAALIGMMCMFFVMEIASFLGKEKIHLIDLICAAIIFGCLLFVLISEAMFAGLATLLTTWRGEIWVKELDYVYLVLGAIGLALSINHLRAVDDPISIPEFIGPFVVVSALVVRVIKTRAEINGWNKVKKIYNS